MKKKCWLLLTILLCLLALTGCRVDESGFEAFQTSLLDDYRSGTTVKIQPEDSDIANFRVVLENEKWELYYNETTAEIACKDKQTGKLFRSNNAQWGQDQEGAQLLINLANEQGTQYAWNSLTDAAAYGQVQYEQMQDAFEVTYLFGKAAQVYVVPEVLTVEAFESILDRVESTGDKNTLKRLFTYLEAERLGFAPDEGKTLGTLFCAGEDAGLCTVRKSIETGNEQTGEDLCFDRVHDGAEAGR